MIDRPRALLIAPPIYDFALFDLFLKPYGLLRLGTMLKKSGWDVRMINSLDYTDPETIKQMGNVKRKPNGTGKIHRSPVANPEQLKNVRRRFARYGILPEELRAKIKDSKPDAVFISSGMTYWYKGVVEAVRTVREIWPGVPVITGGVYSTLMPEHCVKTAGPDFINRGGADNELNDWLEGKNLPGIDHSGNIMPLDHECWNEAAVLRLNEGCPLSCDYCASNKLGRFRPGDPGAVFDWMRHKHESRGTVNFAFYDDALLYKSEEVFKPFLRMVIDYRQKTGSLMNFYTPNALHIRYIDSETAELMKRAGFKEVRLGFESESEEFHKLHDRKYSRPGFHDSIKTITEAGFSRKQIIVYILAGLPGQRSEEVEQTIRFAADKGLTLSVSEFSTVPGSGLWDKCVESSRFPIADEPLYHNNSFFPMEWEHFTREDMQYLKTLSKQSAC